MTFIRIAILIATFSASFGVTHAALGAQQAPERFIRGERPCRGDLTRRHFLDAGFFKNDPQIFYYHYCVAPMTKDQERSYREQVRARKLPFTWDKRFGDNVVFDMNRITGWVEVRGTTPQRELKYQVYVRKGKVVRVVRMTPKRNAVLLSATIGENNARGVTVR